MILKKLLTGISEDPYLKNVFSSALERGKSKNGKYTLIFNNGVNQETEELLKSNNVFRLFIGNNDIWLLDADSPIIKNGNIGAGGSKTTTIPKRGEEKEEGKESHKREVLRMRLKSKINTKEKERNDYFFSQIYGAPRKFITNPPLVTMPKPLESYDLSKLPKEAMPVMRALSEQTKLIAEVFNKQSEVKWKMLKETGAFSDEDLEILNELTKRYVFNAGMTSKELTTGDNIAGAVGTLEMDAYLTEMEDFINKKIEIEATRLGEPRVLPKVEDKDFSDVYINLFKETLKNASHTLRNQEDPMEAISEFIDILSSKNEDNKKIFSSIKTVCLEGDEEGLVLLMTNTRDLLLNIINKYNDNKVFVNGEADQLKYLTESIYNILVSGDFGDYEKGDIHFDSFIGPRTGDGEREKNKKDNEDKEKKSKKDNEDKEERRRNKEESEERQRTYALPFPRMINFILSAIVSILWCTTFLILFVPLNLGAVRDALYGIAVPNIREATAIIDIAEHMDNVRESVKKQYRTINTVRKAADPNAPEIKPKYKENDIDFLAIVEADLEATGQANLSLDRLSQVYAKAYKTLAPASIKKVAQIEASSAQRATVFEEKLSLLSPEEVIEFDKLVEGSTGIPRISDSIKENTKRIGANFSKLDNAQLIMSGQLNNIATNSTANGLGVINNSMKNVTKTASENGQGLTVRETSEFVSRTQKEMKSHINEVSESAIGNTVGIVSSVVSYVATGVTNAISSYASISKRDRSIDLDLGVEMSLVQVLENYYLGLSDTVKESATANQKKAAELHLKNAKKELERTRINHVSQVDNLEPYVGYFNTLQEAFANSTEINFKKIAMNAGTADLIYRYMDEFKSGKTPTVSGIAAKKFSLNRNPNDPSHYLDTLSTLQAGIPITHGSIIESQINEYLHPSLSMLFKEMTGFTSIRAFEQMSTLRRYVTTNRIPSFGGFQDFILDSAPYWFLTAFIFSRSYGFKMIADAILFFRALRKKRGEQVDEDDSLDDEIKDLKKRINELEKSNKASNEEIQALEKELSIKIRMNKEFAAEKRKEKEKANSWVKRLFGTNTMTSSIVAGLGILSDGASRVIHTLAKVYQLDSLISLFVGGISMALDMFKFLKDDLYLALGERINDYLTPTNVLSVGRTGLSVFLMFWNYALPISAVSIPLVYVWYKSRGKKTPQERAKKIVMDTAHVAAVTLSLIGVSTSMLVHGVCSAFPIQLAASIAKSILKLNPKMVDDMTKIEEEKFGAMVATAKDGIMLIDMPRYNLDEYKGDTLERLKFTLLLSLTKSMWMFAISSIAWIARDFLLVRNLENEEMKLRMKQIAYFMQHDVERFEWLRKGPNYRLDETIEQLKNTTNIILMEPTTIATMGYCVDTLKNIDPVTLERYIETIGPFISRTTKLLEVTDGDFLDIIKKTIGK
jgi:hypothetical protein